MQGEEQQSSKLSSSTLSPAPTTTAPPPWWTTLRTLCPSFNLETPLEALGSCEALSLDKGGAEAFYARLDVFLSALREACDDLSREEVAAAPALIGLLVCAIILQLPYVEAGATKDAQPFRWAIEEVVARLQESSQDSKDKSGQVELLITALGHLLADRAALKTDWLKQSALEYLRIQSKPQLSSWSTAAASSAPPSPATASLSTDEPFAAAAERVLTLSQSRKLLDVLSQGAPSKGLENWPGPDQTVLIATNNPHVAERLLVAQAQTPAIIAPHLETLGQALPPNTMRSFDLLLRLDQYRPPTSQQPIVRLLLWKYLLPTYFSRCFAHAQSEDQELCQQDEENEDEGLRKGGQTRVHAATSRTLSRLQAFIKGTSLLEIAGGSALWLETHLHANSKPLSDETQTVKRAAQAILVELQSLALALVRYREASEMLRAVMELEGAAGGGIQ